MYVFFLFQKKTVLLPPRNNNAKLPCNYLNETNYVNFCYYFYDNARHDTSINTQQTQSPL